MFEHWDAGRPDRRLGQTSSPHRGVVVDRSGSLADAALELRLRLALLAEERLVAREVGLDNDRAYVADLDLEVYQTRTSYAAAVLLQLVSFRASIDGRRYG